jgi:hypothetical protein
MASWKYVAAFAVVLPSMAQAQDSSFPMPDYGPLIGNAAQGAATMAAARGRTRSSQAGGTRSPVDASSAAASRTRAQCAKARGWAADRVEHPNLPRVVQMCARHAY